MAMTVGSFRRIAAASAALLVAAGAVAADRVGPGKIENGELVPARAPAGTYGGDGGAACQASTVTSLAMDELAAATQRAGRASPVLDPRVCAVADTFLGWDAEKHGAPRAAVLAFVSSHFGLPVATLPPVVATIGPLSGASSAESENNQLLAERIVGAIGDRVANAVQPRVGIALQRQRRGRTDVVYKVSVTMADAPVELDPLPRRLDAGQKATLSGRLLAGVKDPKIYVSDAVGRLAAPEQPPGDAFRAEVACGDRPGRIMVEIRGTYEGREAVVAQFPVACALPLPERVAIAPAPWPADSAQAEQRILALVNEERARAGFPPLKADPALANVARGISTDLAARGGAPGGPDLGERLKKEGIASPLVLQSAAADRSFERTHERLISSPTNRANLMNAEVTNAGVGAVALKDAAGHPIVYVTEIFIRELPPADVGKMREALRDAVARKRKDARTNALASDATLDDISQKYAEALAAAGGDLSKEEGSKITAPLNKTFRTVTMVSGAKQEPLDFAEEPQTTSPGKALGVGVASGKHPVLGRNATYVVLMVGTPRGAAEAPARRKAAPAAKRK